MPARRGAARANSYGQRLLDPPCRLALGAYWTSVNGHSVASQFATASCTGRSLGTSPVSGCFGSCLKRFALIGPGERFGGWVVALDEREQLGSEVGFAGEDPAAEQAAGEDREEQLDLVQPRGVSRGEVERPPGMVFEPMLDLGGGLVHLEVLEDGVDLLAGWDRDDALLEESVPVYASSKSQRASGDVGAYPR